MTDEAKYMDAKTGCREGGSAYHRKIISEAVLKALRDSGAL